VNLIQINVDAPPEHFDVRVEFYSDKERDAFINSGAGEFVADIPKTIQIPIAEFCTYYLYYRLRPGSETFSHDRIGEKWYRALVEFDERILFNEKSIHVHGEVDLDVGTKERVGEAIGLGIVNNLHRLHLADWTKIPHTTSQKIFDYWQPLTASDGKQFVQVEAKGCAIESFDFSAIPNAIVQHKSKIKAKKADVSEESRTLSILYGTIGVLSKDQEKPAKCLLVDPPSGVSNDPFRFKVVARLAFIANLISVVSPRSVFAASFRTRLVALTALNQIKELDRVPLVNGSGEEFPEEIYTANARHNPLFQARSVVIDGPVGGQVSLVDDNAVFFFGIREELIGLVARQSFSEIAEYSFPPAIIEKTVRCVVPSGRFLRDFKKRIPEKIVYESGGYAQFRLTGALYYSASGLVVGVLPIPIETNDIEK